MYVSTHIYIAHLPVGGELTARCARLAELRQLRKAFPVEVLLHVFFFLAACSASLDENQCEYQTVYLTIYIYLGCIYIVCTYIYSVYVYMIYVYVQYMQGSGERFRVF
jgi:hypothetical protein